MKTRIIHTKFWEDSYIAELNPKEKLLFLYLITNQRVNLVWFYECPDRVILFDTGLSNKELQETKKKFMEDRRVLFVENYVYLVNANKYESYTGEKNKVASEKLLSQISTPIKDEVNRLLDTPIDTPIDTPSIGSISHKSEVISNKLEVINNKSEENFEKFWKTYPRKVNKKKSFEKYLKLVGKDNELVGKIQSAIEMQLETTYKKTEKKYIPHPTTWLNNAKWEDEVETPKKKFANERTMTKKERLEKYKF